MLLYFTTIKMKSLTTLTMLLYYLNEILLHCSISLQVSDYAHYAVLLHYY